MPRIRTIKPEFFQDEKLAPLSPIDRLVFLGLISMADDAGRLLDNVKVIDAFIFPDTGDSAHESLMSLSRIGRIQRGRTSSGQKIIQIVNWIRHQKVQHPQLAAALPELVDIAEDTIAHEPDMNDSGAAHEPLAPRTYDLRPTINDQRPTTKKPRRAKPPRASPDEPASDRTTWLTPALDAWQRHFGPGSLTPGKAGKLLSPVYAAGVPPDEIGRRLGRYCAARKGAYCTLGDFAEHHGEWAEPGEPLLDASGVLTARGERETRPPGMRGNPYGPLGTGRSPESAA